MLGSALLATQESPLSEDGKQAMLRSSLENAVLRSRVMHRPAPENVSEDDVPVTALMSVRLQSA